MIEVTVNRDGTVSTPSGNVFLGNKFENLDETLSFTFPDEFQEYNKYLIGYHKRRKVTVILPINNDIFYVTTGLTYLDGDWTLYAMCRQQVLDLSSDEEVDISPKEGEHVFISDGFSATVAANNIDASAINSAALDQNLKVIYEDLLKVKEELRSEQPIVIDLNIPMNLLDGVSGEIQRIELDDVKIDRNLFLDDEGKCKQFVNVKLSSSGAITPYEFLCAFAGGTVNQINYCGSTIFWQPMIDAIEYSNIIALDFHENHDAENSFVFTLAIRLNLIAGEYYGFVKSAAGFDPEQHTVPAAINEFGEIFVPTSTLESLNAEHKVCKVHIDFIDGVYRSDTTWATIRSYLDVEASCYLYYNNREYRRVGASPTDIQAHYFVYEGNLVRDCFTINRSDEITREETIITPSSDTYGGIKADDVSSNYTVPVKFNHEDGKAYVPTYPTLESLNAKPKDFVVTVTYNDNSYASDKTFDEIKEAYDLGRDCYAVYNMITCKLMSIAGGAAFFMLFSGLVQYNILIGKTGIVNYFYTNQTPSSTNYGGVKADAVDDVRYSVPVKFNTEDGKLYVPTYPSDFSDYIITATITGDQGQGFQMSISYAALLAARNTVLILYQATGDVYTPSAADEGTGVIKATNVKITETGIKVSTFTFSSDESITYSEKEIPIS